VQKRLTLLYPGKHELKITSEQEMSIVLLTIELSSAQETLFEEESIHSNKIENKTPATLA